MTRIALKMERQLQRDCVQSGCIAVTRRRRLPEAITEVIATSHQVAAVQKNDCWIFPPPVPAAKMPAIHNPAWPVIVRQPQSQPDNEPHWKKEAKSHQVSLRGASFSKLADSV
jgi:hypothetical protein